MLRYLAPALLITLCCATLPLLAQEKSSVPGTPWPATDALGRTLPVSGEVGPLREDRFVGIFYFLWLGDRFDYGPYNVTQILADDPLALQKSGSPPWGGYGQYHFWAEPLFGYYNNSDPWILRRHAHLLTDAGIDTLIFDTTNAVTYAPVYRKLCEVYTQIRREGGRTPQFCFMVNTRAGQTARRIYEDLYKPGDFRDLWFHWHGKPLMICDPAEADEELQAFFTLRRAHWPFELVNTPYAWHWESTYPQVYGYTDDPDVPEQVNVAVAQNLRAADGRVTNMSNGDARGRSFHDGAMDKTPGSVNWGHNVQEQWQRAQQLDPPFVMVTSWNEWIAGRWGERGGLPMFVDQLDQQYSRDIEPMLGGHGDNYYLQLIANVRRYKGAPPLPAASAPKSIAIEQSFQQWRDVQPAFQDHVGDTMARDYIGFNSKHYTNDSGRNDLVEMKVTSDATHVYFYARTREAITAPQGPHWMTLLLDTDQNTATGWHGYDLAVNRLAPQGKTASLERYRDAWNWEPVGNGSWRAEGHELQLAVPRAALGLPAETTAFDFKWIDHVPAEPDIMDFYQYGDVAPESRLSYRFVGAAQ